MLVKSVIHILKSAFSSKYKMALLKFTRAESLIPASKNNLPKVL